MAGDNERRVWITLGLRGGWVPRTSPEDLGAFPMTLPDLEVSLRVAFGTYLILLS